jgi:hypothetical protein
MGNLKSSLVAGIMERIKTTKGMGEACSSMLMEVATLASTKMTRNMALAPTCSQTVRLIPFHVRRPRFFSPPPKTVVLCIKLCATLYCCFFPLLFIHTRTRNASYKDIACKFHAQHAARAMVRFHAPWHLPKIAVVALLCVCCVCAKTWKKKKIHVEGLMQPFSKRC